MTVSMRGFTEIINANELNAFEDVVAGFVDAIIKEAHILNRGYVQKHDRSLVMDEGFDVQLIVQTQNRDFEVEVVLCGVDSCNLDSHMFDDGLECSIRETGTWPEREIKIGDLSGSQLFYRSREKSGSSSVLGPELPSPSAIPASKIEPGWRQCSNCADAWQESETTTTSRCPSCASVTELE